MKDNNQVFISNEVQQVNDSILDTDTQDFLNFMYNNPNQTQN